MSSNTYPIIAVGASIAAISFIRTLRKHNDQRPVLLIHGEDRLPYKRTKINKNMVRGFGKDDFKMADPQWYSDQNVTLLYDRVINIDSNERMISTKSGKVFSYGKLLLATGAISVVPVISGLDSQQIHSVQNAADVDRVLAACNNKQRFLIIGAGVEGIETADQLVRKGKQVIVANRMQLPLQKLFPETITRLLEERMEAHGVRLFKGVSVNSITEVDGVYHTRLNGENLEFDAVIACTGALPNVELGRKAGLKVGQGIIVDEYLQTSDKDILAAGDVAQHKNGVVTGLWHAAEHQGQLAALNLLDKPSAHTLPPFRLKTNVFGLYLFSGGYEAVIPDVDEVQEQRHGNILRIMYFSEGKLKAVVFANDGDRAKLYQQALFERWDKKRVAHELPLPPKMSFLFSLS
ncbi:MULTISPECIES: NAD(P)/FAD-dependent oxidoreductase [unclassified Carboxylicivirga]|uniref:NAD(P)/FAD-dependent oxidoreductase n=1 Tax=Carboxylicivirga TaxID=1628153 RepID=UPI003D34A40D